MTEAWEKRKEQDVIVFSISPLVLKTTFWGGSLSPGYRLGHSDLKNLNNVYEAQKWYSPYPRIPGLPFILFCYLKTSKTLSVAYHYEVMKNISNLLENSKLVGNSEML